MNIIQRSEYEHEMKVKNIKDGSTGIIYHQNDNAVLGKEVNHRMKVSIASLRRRTTISASNSINNDNLNSETDLNKVKQTAGLAC